jgi:4-amino-4-deoxy-L-arabinose transferase-like glycosyltransferase
MTCRLSLAKGEAKVRVWLHSHTVTETPHLNPLPSREGTGGSEPLIFGAARRSYRINAVVIAICIFAIAARLILINQPYVDHWSWRQSDVAGIARNFAENGFRFGYPQIDWAGNATGYVGTEFPILPFIAAICYKFAGVHEWIGRSQAMIFFAVSLPVFCLLVREIFGSLAAAWATFFFAFAPVNVFAGRSFMPDVPSLSLSIVGLYFFLQWLRSHAWGPFYLAATAISLSLLIKVTSIVIIAPLAYVAVAGGADPGLNRSRRGLQDRGQRPRLQFALFAAIALLPSVAWYWHAYEIAQRFYPNHFFGAGGIRIENFSWYWAIARQTAMSSLTPILTILTLFGLFVAPQLKSVRGATPLQSRYPLLFHWWLAAVILFVIVVGYGNRHPWYQLPLAPIAAAFAGAACAFFASKVSSHRTAVTLSVLLVTSFAILAWTYVRPLYESSGAQLRNAGLQLSKIAASDALIAAADTGDPTIFYYAHRKGWHLLEADAIYAGNPEDSQEAIADLEKLRRRGATHLVFTINTFWWLNSYPEFAQHLDKSAALIEATPEFKVYELTAE